MLLWLNFRLIFFRYLAWSGQLQTVQQAVMHCTSKMGVGPEIIIPTQQRYLDYLSAMLAGKKPTAAPVSC